MRRVTRSKLGRLAVVSLLGLFLGSCGGGGGGGGGGGIPQQSAEVAVVLGRPGPGDVENRFPFAVGNVWHFQGTTAETGLPEAKFTNIVTVSGTRQVSGVEASVSRESNPGNLGISVETFLFKDANGIANFGNSDPTDPLAAPILPFWEGLFPLNAGGSFVQLDRKGLDFGDDLDGDGIGEMVDLHSVVTLVGFETVVVPVGNFTNCAKVERNLTLTVTLSSSGTRATATDVATAWFASNVGWVKRTEFLSFPAAALTITITEELTGFNVDGSGKGVLPPFSVAENVANPDSDTNRPGRSAIGFDGTTYLLVSCRDSVIPAGAGLFGLFISESGQILGDFQITSDGCPAKPAVAFDGVNYLVTFDRTGQIFGTRVSPRGEVFDGSAGFQISTSSPGSSTNFSSALAFDGQNFLVVWNKFATDNHEIFGSRVTPGGNALGEFKIFSAPGEQVSPSIAFDGVNFLVAWRDTRTGSGPTLDTDIFGTIVTPAEEVLNPLGIPIVTAPGFQGDQPQIAFDGANYLLVWNDIQTLGISPPVDGRIMGRRIAPDGTLIDGPADSEGIAINTTPNSHSPTVAFDGTNFVVAWATGSFSIFPPAGIFAARVSPNGTLLDAPPEALGLSISGPPNSASRLVHPVIFPGGRNSLLSWVNNSETFGIGKSIMGAFIFPL